MKYKKLLAFMMATVMVTSMSLTAFAKEADGVEYEKITNEDGSDPVWVVKGSSEDPGEGRKVEETQEFKAEQVAIVTGEITNVEDCNKGEVYEFIQSGDSDSLKPGTVIASVPEGSAEVEFLGEGKDEQVTQNAGSPSTPAKALEKSITNLENEKVLLKSKNDKIEKCKNCTKEEFVTSEFKELAIEFGYSPTEVEGKTVDQLIEMMTSKRLPAKYLKAYAEQFEMDYAAYIKMEPVDAAKHDEILSKMKELQASGNEAAILEYFGMTADEIQNWTKNAKSANYVLTKNSGFVDVIQSGTGFDGCKQGVIMYMPEKDGGCWEYVCVNGGVAFGEASDLHLLEVEKKSVKAEAVTVIPAAAINLDQSGNGTVKLSDVKVQIVIEGKTYDVSQFKFLDNVVYIHSGQKDVHATVLIAGFPYTLTFSLNEWSAPTGGGTTSAKLTPVQTAETGLPIGGYINTKAGIAPFVTKELERAGWTSISAYILANKPGSEVSITMNGSSTLANDIMTAAVQNKTNLSLKLDNNVDAKISTDAMAQIMSLPTVDEAGKPIIGKDGKPVSPKFSISALTYEQGAYSHDGTCGFSLDEMKAIGAGIGVPVVKIVTTNTDPSKLVTLTFDASKLKLAPGQTAYLYGGKTGEMGLAYPVTVDANGMITCNVQAVNGFWTIGTQVINQ